MTFAEIIALCLSVAAFSFSFGAWFDVRRMLNRIARLEVNHEQHLADEHSIFDAETWQESDSSNWRNLKHTAAWTPKWLDNW